MSKPSPSLLQHAQDGVQDGSVFYELVMWGWLQMGAGTPATSFLFLDNMVKAAELLDDAERADIAEDVKVRDPTSVVRWVICWQGGCVCVCVSVVGSSALHAACNLDTVCVTLRFGGVTNIIGPSHGNDYQNHIIS